MGEKNRKTIKMGWSIQFSEKNSNYRKHFYIDLKLIKYFMSFLPL